MAGYQKKNSKKMNKLLVVGDSFVAEDNSQYYEWAWWNRLAKDLRLTPVNLAITGASNFNIFHQLIHGMNIGGIDKILVILTAPNRIESVKQPIKGRLSYENFKNKDVKSWALHDRISNNEIPIEIAETFHDHEVSVSLNIVIANMILNEASRRNCCILSNLFTQYEKYSWHLKHDIKPREFIDIESGPLDELETGHIYQSWHDKFYEKYKSQLITTIS